LLSHSGRWGRAHDVPVGALLRDGVASQPNRPRKIYIALTSAAVITLAAVAVGLAYDRRVAIIYVAVAALVFVTLRFVASLLMSIARHAPRVRSTRVAPWRSPIFIGRAH